MTMESIHQLTFQDRLDLIEQLWDSLSENPDAVPLSKSQRRELDRRLDDLERVGPVGIPWDEVVLQIRKRAR